MLKMNASSSSNNSAASNASKTLQATRSKSVTNQAIGGSRSKVTTSKSRSRSKSYDGEVDKEQLEQIMIWLDGLSLSRPRFELTVNRIEREFADGYLVAELIAQHYPKLVDMHNFTRGSSIATKRHNWLHLRRKILSKLCLDITDEDMDAIAEVKPGAIHKVLKAIHDLAKCLEAQKREAEEERARAGAESLPLENWKQDICFSRNDLKGQKEFMIQGKLMIAKDAMMQEVEKRDLELTELKASTEQLRAQVARLQMTVDLKEDRLGELTHQLSIFHRHEATPSKIEAVNTPPAPGPGGDAAPRKSTSRISFSKYSH